jgi:hypothetical protein
MGRFTRAFGITAFVMISWTLFATPCLARNCGVDQNGFNTGKANYLEVYASKYAVWCVDESFWPENSEQIKKFFVYYDSAVAFGSLFPIRRATIARSSCSIISSISSADLTVFRGSSAWWRRTAFAGRWSGTVRHFPATTTTVNSSANM